MSRSRLSAVSTELRCLSPRLAFAAVLLASGVLSADSTRLLGVDAKGTHAFVTREGAGWSLMTIDVDSGKTIATWSTTPANADDRTGTRSLIKFFPVDGTVATDLVKFATIVAHTGSASRAYWINGQRTATGHVFLDNSSIELADAKGVRLGTLGTGSTPKVSPDGQLVAWENFEGHIVVSQPRLGAKPVQATLKGARGMQWSVDGKSVLVTADTCIYRLAASTLKETKVHCDPDLLAFAQDPTGRTIAATTAEDVAWLDAATGKRLGSAKARELSLASEDATLGPGGLFVSLNTNGRDLIAVDLSRGTTKWIKAEPKVFFEGVRATRWIGNAIVVLHGGVLQRIDVAKLLR